MEQEELNVYSYIGDDIDEAIEDIEKKGCKVVFVDEGIDNGIESDDEDEEDDYLIYSAYDIDDDYVVFYFQQSTREITDIEVR